MHVRLRSSAVDLASESLCEGAGRRQSRGSRVESRGVLERLCRAVCGVAVGRRVERAAARGGGAAAATPESRAPVRGGRTAAAGNAKTEPPQRTETFLNARHRPDICFSSKDLDSSS